MKGKLMMPKMDWQQVVLNGGPPCFAVLDDEPEYYCGRAERWEGHDGDHEFVSLESLLQPATTTPPDFTEQARQLVKACEARTGMDLAGDSWANDLIDRIASALAEAATQGQARNHPRLTFEQAEEAGAMMRRLEDDATVDKHALRLFMQEPMPCGHAAGNLLTCSEPPFGCLICGPIQG